MRNLLLTTVLALVFSVSAKAELLKFEVNIMHSACDSSGCFFQFGETYPVELDYQGGDYANWNKQVEKAGIPVNVQVSVAKTNFGQYHILVISNRLSDPKDYHVHGDIFVPSMNLLNEVTLRGRDFIDGDNKYAPWVTIKPMN